MLITIGKTQVSIERGIARWVAGMAIDFDGAPNAYAPIGVGKPLDALGNAGSPGKWWGLACTDGGEPFVQRQSDPFPGYYISTTALVDPNWPARDPRKYVDARRVPYIAVPKALLSAGVRKGDLCLVECGALRSAAIVADVGPAGKIGEGSPALATALGIPAGRSGGCRDGVLYRVFIGSAEKLPWPRPDFQSLPKQLPASHVPG